MATLLTAALVSSCGVLSGLDSLGVVDCAGAACSGGGTEGGTTNGDGQAITIPDETSTPPQDAGPDTQGGDAACDPTMDPTCLPLPPPDAGAWTLVALASAALAPAATACPTGLDVSSVANEGPTPKSTACQCGCTVTSQASCPIGVGFNTSCGQSGQSMSNNPAGTCLTDLYNQQRDFNSNWKFSLQAPTGGLCSAAPTLNAALVDYASQWRVCDNTTRCSGGVCNAVLAAPFAACLVSAGDVSCPAGYPTKHVVGVGASFTCGQTCGCNVSKSCSAGTVTFYTDPSCGSGARPVPVDATCDQPFNGGTYQSYKSSVTPTTTCTPTGSSTAANVKVTSARTICCH